MLYNCSFLYFSGTSILMLERGTGVPHSTVGI